MNENYMNFTNKQKAKQQNKYFCLGKNKLLNHTLIFLSVKNNTMYCSGCVCSENIKTQ